MPPAPPKRPHIALDIDGVLADFAGGFLPHLSRALGREVREEHITTYSFEEALRIPREVWAPIWDEFQHRVYHEALPYAGVVEGFEALRDLGRLTIQTARPDRAAEATIAWLERHLGPVEVQFRRGLGKYRHADAVDWFIEDSLEEIARAEAGVPILIDRAWNRLGAPAGIARVRTLIEAARHIEVELRGKRA